MAACVALLRGINVGKAKRLPMAELRALCEGLGFTDVRTLLNSGNVIFRAARPNPAKISAKIEAAIRDRFGFPVPVVVVTADELDAIIAANTLPHAPRDPSRFLVAFAASADALAKAGAMKAKPWAPDALAVGDKAAYLWCDAGVIESKLMQAFAKATGDGATARNWATVLKLQSAARD